MEMYDNEDVGLCVIIVPLNGSMIDDDSISFFLFSLGCFFLPDASDVIYF